MEFLFDTPEYREFLAIEDVSNDNSQELELMKKNAALVISEVLTKKQKLYLVEYFVEGLTMYEIAERHNLEKSTISRTVTRGKQKLALLMSMAHPKLREALHERNVHLKFKGKEQRYREALQKQFEKEGLYE